MCGFNGVAFSPELGQNGIADFQFLGIINILNKDGTLTRGAIYLPYLSPSTGYSKKLNSLTKKQKDLTINKLKTAKQHLTRQYKVPAKLMNIDTTHLRIITNPGVTQHLSEEIISMNLKPAIVTEYPTWDALIVELDLL